MTFGWEGLGKYRASGVMPDGADPRYAAFFSPVDDLHKLLVDVLAMAENSVVVSMFGFTDTELASLLDKQIHDPRIYVQVSLDSTQFGGPAEKKALATLLNDAPGNSIAIGQSTGHAISHLKVLIVDGTWVVSGSTNWSLGGEMKQDNVVDLSRDPLRAAVYRSILDRSHTAMLAQMAAKAAKAAP